MAKRVLIAEASDTIRGVATTVLRQNGYEVISVATAQKALEVLNHTSPNLIITGSNLAGPGGSLFHERVTSDNRFAATPILLFVEPGQPSPACPDEAVMKLPFDPKDFLDRVATFTAATSPIQQSSPPNPLDGAGLEDAAIDVALGLDHIEVTGSEVMNKTTIERVKKKKVTDKMIGYEHSDTTDTSMSDSSRVDSIMIRDESSDIKPGTDAPHSPTPLNASGKLDILNASDQYGIANPEDFAGPAGDANHDYDWFINEMKRESQGAPVSASADAASTSQGISVTDTASYVDPITPSPGSPPGGETVEKFIDEFKKEVDKIHDSEPQSIVVEADSATNGGPSVEHGWEDSLERISPEQIKLFKREFVTLLAEKIASKIVDKIDSQKLLSMLKNEILAQQNQKTQDRS